MAGEIQIPPKQVLYPVAGFEVRREADARILVIHVPGEDLVFPMGVENAEAIGKELTAPGIVVPKPNGNGRGR